MAAPVSRRVYSSASFSIRPNTMRHIILDENIDMTAIQRRHHPTAKRVWLDVQLLVYIKNVKQTHAYVANKNTIQITGYAKLWNKQKYTGKPDDNSGYINYECKGGMSHAISHACKADF